MTTATAPQVNLRLNFNNRDYEFEDLPRSAQVLLQDMVRIDQQISELQFQLRHLQAARHTYGSSLSKAMKDEEQNPDHADGDGLGREMA
jgi:hypothetical protein